MCGVIFLINPAAGAAFVAGSQRRSWKCPYRKGKPSRVRNTYSPGPRPATACCSRVATSPVAATHRGRLLFGGPSTQT